MFYSNNNKEDKMLQLKNIIKTYVTGGITQQALKGISLNFRENEFVSILGQSGSGKTTLLNIIGGLDQYTDGDLIINGISTKQYKSSDWDVYRNQSIGFIFQSYNLISHQTVLANVELALTLAGISKKERRQRAIEVLEKVGLKDHLHKKPNQMSGGQMQRVAIARALINNPDILLADEPTGALDSETSIQVMELLKEIAKDKLVIMVTHNPELAQEYSTRIIRLKDGVIQGDTNPYAENEMIVNNKEVTVKKSKKNRVSMSFFTALALSFNNLKTKKGRTILTSFAGSIGIIGIALILALSSGMQAYIANVEEDTLSSYPITIQNQGIDLLKMQSSTREGMERSKEEHKLDKVYQGGYAADTLQMQNIKLKDNDLKTFKEYIESKNGKKIRENTNAIQYGYPLNLQIYKSDTTKEIVQVNPSSVLEEEENYGQMADSMKAMGVTTSEVWTEMIDNQKLLTSQYDLLAGEWPNHYDEVVLVLDENNEISDMTLYALGLKDSKEIERMRKKLENGKDLSQTDYSKESYSYDDILKTTFKLVLNTDYYQKKNGIWMDKKTEKSYMKKLINNGITIRISGIIRPSKDTAASSIQGTIGYTNALTKYVMKQIHASKIVKEQKKNPGINVFTGEEFVDAKDISEQELLEQLEPNKKAMILSLPEAERNVYLTSYKESLNTTYEDNLELLGSIRTQEPSSISLYLKDFDAREAVIEAIQEYNDQQVKAGKESNVIEYTDMVGIMTSSITSIINMITYLLIGFVSISLVVSSIMIGIITYISVLERTKEIGILRSIGASKKDVSRVFNAETMIVGFSAGAIGILVTILLTIPINHIIETLSGVANIAVLPVGGAITLIIISIVLTMIAGFIPAKMAAKKDPVIALRSE